MNQFELSSQIEKLSIKVEELTELNRSLYLDKHSAENIANNWIPRSSVMKFFGYGDTQMSAIARKYQFICAKIGAKTFYHRDSIAKAFSENIVK